MEVAELLCFQVALEGEGKGFPPAVGTCSGTGIYHGQVFPTHLPVLGALVWWVALRAPL